jgi:hypothetical protein
MQTFLPYSDFKQTAKILDMKRLGKQRVEAYQILKVLRGETNGWRNHPAVLMWRDYEPALAQYGRIVCVEWRGRGYQDTLLDKFPESDVVYPPWLGDTEFHRSHQANLVRKLPEHYRKYFPSVDETLPYIWPIE